MLVAEVPSVVIERASVGDLLLVYRWQTVSFITPWCVSRVRMRDMGWLALL